VTHYHSFPCQYPFGCYVLLLEISCTILNHLLIFQLLGFLIYLLLCFCVSLYFTLLYFTTQQLALFNAPFHRKCSSVRDLRCTQRWSKNVTHFQDVTPLCHVSTNISEDPVVSIISSVFSKAHVPINHIIWKHNRKWIVFWYMTSSVQGSKNSVLSRNINQCKISSHYHSWWYEYLTVLSV
jgi:hypothetical protein